MCRLLGLIANKEVDLRFSLVEGPTTLRSLSQSNQDGWGLGWYEDGRPKVVKEPAPAHSSQSYRRTSAEATSRVFIAHVRRATTGSCCTENCHPFQYGRWLFAHNGSVDRKALLDQLNEVHRLAIVGETDSEAFFHWILQKIEEASSPEEGIANALGALKDGTYTALNFLLSDGEHLYAYRNAACSHGYYSLSYLVRPPGPRQPETFYPREVRAMLESKCLRGERAVVVCSEKLTGEPWKDIPLGNLLVVGLDLKPTLKQL
ncbi:class II glutamine amidotransferase [Limisphaera sp. VF-2]|jgi:predicted glutamine amidotransferase|uniref:class II glutamine amidotransferase n=1 Tax=Limisphaera sp. VF-2 TaxID=3400418 RepID=UPI0017638775|nr:class II glutamine amidotransferase [Limisphaera sp.]